MKGFVDEDRTTRSAERQQRRGWIERATRGGRVADDHEVGAVGTAAGSSANPAPGSRCTRATAT
jgi:hypothetical protein